MGRLINGKYESGNFPMQEAVPTKTSLWRQSDHDRQRQDHKWELIKPFLPNGEPNPEFITAYPAESEEVYKFTKSSEQLAREQNNHG